MSETLDPGFETLIEYLKSNRGFDFTGYKRSSLQRRINKRMEMVSLDEYSDYLDYLEVHPQEFVSLFNMILINVTSFFRDPPAWQYMDEEIVPRLVNHSSPGGLIRIWNAGCASGEETYSTAMLIAEHLGEEAFRDRVKIYATDLDEEALAQARLASYTPDQMDGVSADLQKRYFEQVAERFVFRKDLRRAVIFGRHDLVQDAPISRVDLLVCRNTLMYFNADTQARILGNFNFALKDGGYLFLGKAEMLLTHANLFAPVDLKRRVFSKVPQPLLRDRLLVLAGSGQREGTTPLVNHALVREAAFQEGAAAQIVLDSDGTLLQANDRARTLFHLSTSDLGRGFQELELSYRPAELRSLVQQAQSERRVVALKEVEWSSGGSAIFLDIQVAPLTEGDGNVLGSSVTFVDVTRTKTLQDDLQHSNQELETAYEELQSTNEELETTNEELQSTVEELETTNEELHSTNEELETTNEELQSTNEELQTMNEELRQRGDELNAVNAWMESMLGSLHGAVIVVDEGLTVQAWNRTAEDLWGLRADEVQGKNLLSLDIGLQVERLTEPLRACLTGQGLHEMEIEATNRRGKPILCRVHCRAMRNGDGALIGAIVVMEEAPLRGKEGDGRTRTRAEGESSGAGPSGGDGRRRAERPTEDPRAGAS